MKNWKQFKWALSIALPVLVFAAMLFVARERRRIVLTGELIEEARTSARIKRIRALVEQGADANGKLPDWNVAMKGSTALHFLVLRYKNDQKPKMLFLLRHGANIDARNEYGWTPLMLASSVGADTSVRFLIGNGAQVNARTPPPAFVVDAKGVKQRTALGFARVTLETEMTKPKGDRIPQLKETIRILQAAGAKE